MPSLLVAFICLSCSSRKVDSTKEYHFQPSISKNEAIARIDELLAYHTKAPNFGLNTDDYRWACDSEKILCAFVTKTYEYDYYDRYRMEIANSTPRKSIMYYRDIIEIKLTDSWKEQTFTEKAVTFWMPFQWLHAAGVVGDVYVIIRLQDGGMRRITFDDEKYTGEFVILLRSIRNYY